MSFSRRNFLKLSGTLGAGFLLGACSGCSRYAIFAPGEGLGGDADAEARMLGWLAIQADGTVRVAVSSSEMGQGVYTNLALIVAEELDADFGKVQAEPAPVNKMFNNPKMFSGQVTGGSTSTPGYWTPMREVGATARLMLLQAAAARWKVEAATLSTQPHKVVHPDGRTLGYGELAAEAARLDVPATPKLKSPSAFRLIGTRQKRLDTPDKVRGAATFGVDVRRPNMVYASVRHARALHGKVTKVTNLEAVRQLPGVLSVEVFETWVAVIASSWWQANQAVKQLELTEDNSEVMLKSTEDRRQALLTALNEHGKKPPKKATKTLDVEYEVPFLEHGTMSPMNCTVELSATGCDVWAPTQAQTNSRKTAAAAAGLEPEQVRIHTTYLGGGFGRRSNTDFVEQAVLLAKRAKRPVQLIWSREETTQHGYYRPAAIARFQIGVNAQGDASHWAAQIAVPNILSHQIPAVPSVVWKVAGDPIAMEGFKKPPYAVDDRDVDGLSVKLDTRLGFWRAVGHSHNGFFVEGVADEVARLSGQDPAAYRRRCYADHPRHLKVLDKVTAMAKWGTARQPGRHLGLAVHESFGSVCGQVVELSVAADKTVTLHKIWCAIDCGVVVNPDSVEAQMQGGVVYGLAAATRAQIDFEGGAVVQSNFHDYPTMRLAEIPPMEVAMIESDDDPGGVGEVGLPPIAAAVANAIFAANGERLRRQPFSLAGYTRWQATRG
ncbi:MAG: molybdopterin cofactor-binding domain-containing protein [Myxococcota bacterium]|nr:molybdopterin cofactor-binding domain-containing protein [Myxococcota bacterium]